MKTFLIEEEFKNLVNNGWLTDDEAKVYQTDKDIKDAINSSTSPKKEDIFNALKRVPLKGVKVLILGKDPYPNPKDAHGYAFSSMNSTTPDSLKNIFKALDSLYGSNLFLEQKNVLTSWAEQGVLLLNTGLTFQRVDDDKLTPKERTAMEQTIQRKNMKIWRDFVNTIIGRILSVKDRPIVLMLWGKDAHDIVFRNIKNKDFQKCKYDRGINIIPDTSIMVLQASHPSPLAVNRGGDFPKIAPVHFEACDRHLGANKINWIKL